MEEIARKDGNLPGVLDGYVQQGRMFLFNAAQNLVQYGRVLTEAKPLVAHGQFGAWVQENFNMSERSAQGYMAVWRRFGRSEQLSGVQFSSLQKMLALPEGTEEQFAADNNLAEMTARQVEAAVKKVRQEADAQIAAARAETQAARNAQADAERRSREEREQDRGLIAQAAEKDAQLRTAERKAAAAQAEAAEAKEQHRAAVAALETARRELRDTEELLAESQSEYDRLQGEMLNARSEKAKGDAERSISEQLTGDDFAAAVRLFLGSVAQVPYMGGQFARLEAGEYEQWDSLLKAIEDWAQRARNALDGKERIIDGR